MKLSDLPIFEQYEAEVACRQTIAETWGRVYHFDYENYDTDPKPSVLVLGYWNHPTTKNTLLGGINLRYLAAQQVRQLQQSLPTILKPRNLKLRYRIGKKLLPDIFKAYRTYDKRFVSAITPETLKFWDQKAELKKQQKEKEKQQLLAKQTELQKQREKEQAQQEPPEEPEEIQAAEIDQATQEREKESEYHGKLKQLSQAAQVAKQKEADRRKVAATKPAAPAPRQELDVKPQIEPTPDLLREPLPGEETPEEEEDKIIESRDFFYSPKTGYVWQSPASYIRWHEPQHFRIIDSHLPRLPVLAVYDTRTGRILLDRVSHHARILQAANLDYAKTVRLERSGRSIVAFSDGLPVEVMEAAKNKVRYLI
jgi:hypothetical protein